MHHAPVVHRTPSTAATASQAAAIVSPRVPTIETTFAAASAASTPPVELGDAGTSWTTWFVTLLMVAALVWLACRRIAGLANRTTLQRSARIIETTRLGDQTRLTVIHFKGRELLLAHGPRAIALLTERPVEGRGQPIQAGNAAATTAGFEQA
jgi:flagellar biogenesis protein FliO